MTRPRQIVAFGGGGFSMEAVKAFAGDQPEVARFYPEDDDFLVDRELTVEHHEVAEP